MRKELAREWPHNCQPSALHKWKERQTFSNGNHSSDCLRCGAPRMLCAAGVRDLAERRSYPVALAQCSRSCAIGSPEMQAIGRRYLALPFAQRGEMLAELARLSDMRETHGSPAESSVVNL